MLEPVFFLFPLSFVGAIACLVMRYRRSDDKVRHQIQWIALGGLTFVGSAVVVMAVLQLGRVDTASFEGQVLTNITLIGYSLVPISIGFSVLKYRLYDIDVIVNRALVYGLLTTTLALAYLVTVALLQQLSRPLTGLPISPSRSRPSRLPRSSAPCAFASKPLSTAASIAASTTQLRRWRRSRRACGTRSTSTA